MYREKEEKIEPGTFTHVVTYLCYSSKIRWFEPAVRFSYKISSSFETGIATGHAGTATGNAASSTAAG